MNRVGVISAVCVAALGLAACDQAVPVGPAGSSPIPQPPTHTPLRFQFPPVPPSQTLVSEWEGSSLVDSVDSLPVCIPVSWQGGFSGSVSWQLLKSADYARDQFDLHLLQKASGEFCHLNASIVGNTITAKSWDEEGFGFEGEAFCHFQLPASDWGCAPNMAPEVWIDGITVNGSFTDASQNRIQGTMDIKYDHRSGNTSYVKAMVLKLFDVVKTSP
jgi:hypothetical protein